MEDVSWLTTQSWLAEWGHSWQRRSVCRLQSNEAGWYVKRAASQSLHSKLQPIIAERWKGTWVMSHEPHKCMKTFPLLPVNHGLARTWCKFYSSTMTEPFWEILRFPCSQHSKHLSIRLKFIWLQRSFSSSKILCNISLSLLNQMSLLGMIWDWKRRNKNK